MLVQLTTRSTAHTIKAAWFDLDRETKKTTALRSNGLSARGPALLAAQQALGRSAEQRVIADIRDSEHTLGVIEHQTKDVRKCMYRGEVDETVFLQLGLIARIKQIIAQMTAARRLDPLSPTGVRWIWILGRLYNDLGYARSLYLGDHSGAQVAFTKALPLFEGSHLPEEWANTCDNIGRTHAREGYPTQGKSWVDKGRRRRDEILQMWQVRAATEHDEITERALVRAKERVALSHISEAALSLAQENYRTAEDASRQALKISQPLGYKRGVGLARIPLGRALHGQALAEDLGPWERRRLFAEGIRHLAGALDIFDPVRSLPPAGDRTPVPEPIRVSEANLALGRIYLDRSRLCSEPEAALSDLHTAVQFFNAGLLRGDKNCKVLYAALQQEHDQTKRRLSQLNRARAA